jgi:Xaa-Pro dipeptidase
MKQIPSSEFDDRLQRARNRLSEKDLEAAIVVGRSFYDRCGDLAYLTNHFPPFPTTVFDERTRGMGHAILLLPVDRDPVLIVDGRSYRADLVAIDDVRLSTDLIETLGETISQYGMEAARIALVGSDIVPYAMILDLNRRLPNLCLKPFDELLLPSRSRKSEAEIALLRDAADVAAAGLDAALEAIRPGIRETDICAAGMEAAYSAGADFVRYLRVHSGTWSAWGSRWPQATDRTIESGDLVALDIIGAKAGYQFDVLRTTIAGDPGNEQVRVCEAVAGALKAAVAEALPGVKAGVIASTARRHLAEAGYGEHASSFVGHGIGLETCEIPYLTPESDFVLPESAVLCIEPGVYIPDWGGASIEQEVVIRSDGPEILTRYPVQTW